MFWIFVLFVGDSAVKMAPKHSAEVLSGVPKGKEAVMCLTEISLVQT